MVASKLICHAYVYTSLKLTALLPGVGPVSASLNTITTVVAAWIATSVTTVWIALDSAVSISIICLILLE